MSASSEVIGTGIGAWFGHIVDTLGGDPAARRSLRGSVGPGPSA